MITFVGAGSPTTCRTDAPSLATNTDSAIEVYGLSHRRASCDVHDNPITTAYRLEEPYAMDWYGNLFLTESLDAINGRVNDSWFNADREVICAGIVTIENGVLMKIDNTSGHYKPTKRHLHDALVVLQEVGVDLSETIVTVLEMAEMAVTHFARVEVPN